MRKIPLVAIALLTVLGGLGGPAHPAGALVDSAVIMPTPLPGPETSHELYGVSCSSETHCMAVGLTRPGSVNQPLSLSWDGTEWVEVPIPAIDPESLTELRAVSCVSESFCAAAGYVEGASPRPVVLIWDGSAWTPAVIPAFSGMAFLRSVSCTSETSCTAVGNYTDGHFRTLALAWDGASWSVQPTPDANPADFNVLMSVSCISSTWCLAAGYHQNDPGNQPMSLLWDGSTWSLLSTPWPLSGATNLFHSVSCSSEIFCVGVGTAFGGAWNTPFALLWNGTSWVVEDLPIDDDRDQILNAVSCPTNDQCVAVGFRNTEAGNVSFVLTRDGAGWTSLPTPTVAPPETTSADYLHSVSCVSTEWCLAAGHTYDETTPAFRTLALLLTGAAPSPPTPPDITVPTFTG